jgi:hypothetical protein
MIAYTLNVFHHWRHFFIGISEKNKNILFMHTNRIISGLLVIVASLVNAQTITTIAGNGTSANSGDGGPAVSASIQGPSGVAVDGIGNIYISSFNIIRKVNSAGTISTIAGSYTMAGASGNGGPATFALLNGPDAIVCDALGNIYFVDFNNNWIRKINTSGIISVFAGNGTMGFSGDGGTATSASLNKPLDLAIDGVGNIYILDVGNNRIRKVNTSGIISTYAGTGTYSFSGDGGPAILATFQQPSSITADLTGNVYVADYWNRRIRKIDSSGIINTIAGTGTAGYSGDNGPALAAQISDIIGMATDAAGNLYLSDQAYHVIREINTTGTINTICGTGVAGFSGDGGPAISAQLNVPRNLTVHSNTLFIVDQTNSRIRTINNINVYVNENNLSEIYKIYPNPTRQFLNISTEHNDIQNLEIEIINYLGQTILKTPYANSVDVSELSQGIYTLKISDKKNQNYYSKFVKE